MLDLGSKDVKENCLGGGENLNGIWATAVDTAMGIGVGEVVELDDTNGILVEGRLGSDEVRGTSEDDDDKDEGVESEGDWGSSDSSEETESRRREETGESSNSPSLPEPLFTFALLF